MGKSTSPKKEIDEVNRIMKNVGTFFKKNALSFKAMRSARKYQQNNETIWQSNPTISVKLK